jgi:hypothetical protein
MALEGDLRTALTGDATVAGIVAGRIYQDVAPQEATYPHIIFEGPSGGPLQTSGGPSSTHNVTFFFVCRALTKLAAKALGDAAKDVLDGWTNTSGTPAVSSCRLEDEQPSTEYRSDDSEELVFVITQEYSLWYA